MPTPRGARGRRALPSRGAAPRPQRTAGVPGTAQVSTGGGAPGQGLAVNAAPVRPGGARFTPRRSVPRAGSGRRPGARRAPSFPRRRLHSPVRACPAGLEHSPLARWSREPGSDVVRELLRHASDRAYGKEGAVVRARVPPHPGSLSGKDGDGIWRRRPSLAPTATAPGSGTRPCGWLSSAEGPRTPPWARAGARAARAALGGQGVAGGGAEPLGQASGMSSPWGIIFTIQTGREPGSVSQTRVVGSEN